LIIEPHVTALADDTLVVSYASGGDIFGFNMDAFGSLTSGNLLAALSQSTSDPLGGAQIVQQTNGSLVTEFRQFPSDTNADIQWHAIGAADPANKFPIEDSGQSFTLRDATATAGGGTAVAFETTLGGRTFADIKFIGANRPTNEGTILVGAHANQSQINPSIIGLSNGNVAIAYENFASGRPRRA
jgi:hypothetical protein